MTALVKTKTLQLDNYRDGYGFDVLMGRANYKCIRYSGWCNACPYVGKTGSMRNCPDYHDCHYVLAREQVKASPRRSINSAYFLAAPWAREEPGQVLVCDEADELPDLVCDHAGVEVSERQRREWELPAFPRVRSARSNVGQPFLEMTGWLEKARDVLRREWQALGKRSDARRLAQCERLGIEIGRAYNAMAWSDEGWHLQSGNGKLVAKPLTARHHFPGWFGAAQTVVLMSATIGGDGSTLAQGLGIGDGYAFQSVPNRWPAEDRPVWIPADAPRIGGKAKLADYEHQADLAARAILDCPPDWSGLVLCTSKAETKRVADRLARRGLQDRVWVTPEKHGGRWAGTETHAALWEERRQRVPGSLCVSWNFWRGYDGLDERIVLAMKTPFAPRGEPGSYQAEKVRADGAMYHWRAANRLAQGCGRTRRGRDEDYGEGTGLVGVLDQNFRMVKKHLPRDFLEAVVQ
jgi:Rad3-related DNA helicase